MSNHHPAPHDIDDCDFESGLVPHCWQTFEDEVLAERQRAHQKHGGGSAEQIPWDNFGRWQAILFEEVGEVARAICEHALGNVDLSNTMADLREELVQVAAMAEAWAMSIDRATDR